MMRDFLNNFLVMLSIFLFATILGGIILMLYFIPINNIIKILIGIILYSISTVLYTKYVFLPLLDRK